MPRPQVQIILADHSIPASLRTAVQQTGACASFRDLSEVLRRGLSPAADAVVVVVPDDVRAHTHALHVLFDRLADQPRATLLLKASGQLVPRLAHPRTLPVTFGCGLDAGELTARLTTMLEMRDSLDSLHRGMVANRLSGESAAKRYVNQLRLASQVQRGFLPEALPPVGPVSFATVFRPVDYVSGDIYDVQRLDEDHVAVALADATGHGIPAALLTVFIKRALRGKEIHAGQYRILRPDEVLARLNEDVLDANLAECPFVAATYALLNVRTLELSLARGGSPYPILRRKNGALELLRPAGGVVGVARDARFAVETVQLEPGDALLVCSDGLERVVLPQLPPHALAEAFARAADVVREHNAIARHAATPARICADDDTAVGLGSVIAAPAGATHGTAPAGMTAMTAADRGGRPVPWHGAGGATSSRVARGAPTFGREGRPTIGVAVSLPTDVTGAAARETSPPAEQAFLASAWCERLRHEGARAALQQLTIRYETLRRTGHALDDLTVVAMQIES